MLVTEDAVFKLPGDRPIPTGRAGALAFATQHAEADGRKPSVVLIGAEAASDGRWVTSLRFANRDLATDETLFELTVGGVFTLEGDRISSLQAFPSYEEAVVQIAQG